MKSLFALIFSFSAIASSITDNTFNLVKPALENTMRLNKSYSSILDEAKIGNKLDDSLSLKILDQIESEKLSLNRSIALLNKVESKLNDKNATDVDLINLKKMREALKKQKDYTEKKIATLRTILLASKNHSSNKV